MNQFTQYIMCTPLLLSSLLSAGDFEVISGSATASTQGSHTVIENSPQAILHWDNFSISAQESLHFSQQNAASSVLNRVTGKELSALMGTLTSNGKVYLINPQGVVIGPNAYIETAGFIASTSDILNADFLKGKELLFNLPGDGKITNQGMIHCPEGDIFLIAKEISNEGNCTGNYVGMASGTQVLIRPEGEQRVYIRCEPLESGEIDHTGTLQALAIELKSSSPYDKAIRMGGSAEVLCFTQEGGKIILSAEQGGVQVDGNLVAASGQIQVLGKEIQIDSSADLNVSGKSGGSIFVGGGSRGQDPNLFNATNVTVDSGAKLSANASDGDAGRVIIWANQVTDFNGHIDAQALGAKGNGGFAEISALEGLRVNDHPDLRSIGGTAGLLLLDPGAVAIVSGGNVPPPVTLNTFNDSWISAQLGIGSLTIDTANSTVGSPFDITVNTGTIITWSTNTTLTLNASNQIFFNGAITNTANGNLAALGAAGIRLSSASACSFTFQDGTISLTGLTNGILGSAGSALSTTNGTIFLNGQANQGAFSNYGIEFNFGLSTISTIDGHIHLNAEISGNGTAVNQIGQALFFVGLSSTGTGSITLNSTLTNLSGGPGVNTFGITFGGGFSSVTVHDGNLNINANTIEGLAINVNSPLTSTGTGNIIINGSSLGPDTALNAYGINIASAGSIASNGTGGIFLNGVCGNSTTLGGTGVLTQGPITSVSGPIVVSGSALGTSSNQFGIHLNRAVTATGSASIDLIGTANSSATGSVGIQCDGNAPFLSVSSVDGNITMTGSGNTSGISMLQNNTLTPSVSTTGTGSISINTVNSSDFLFGPAANIFAQGTGSLAITCDRDLIMQGSGANGDTIIQHNTGMAVFSIARNLIMYSEQTGGTTHFCTIRPGIAASLLFTNIGGDLILQSQPRQNTAGVDPIQIGSPSSGASGNIHFARIGGSVQLNCTDESGYIIIGHGGPFIGSFTYNGNILIQSVGNITLTGATVPNAIAGTVGFAQIGHMGSNSSMGGNISVSSQGSINVLGGSIASTAYAQIGHGAPLPTVNTIGACTMNVQAGTDIRIFSSTADALIVNGSAIPGSGNLTLVADNLFPSPPGAGFGRFNFGSTLSATGKLKIYTSAQSLNYIIPGTLINGAPFFPGALYKNSSTEEWGIWFPDGSYGSEPFKFYYKDDFFGIPAELVIANMGSLTDLLPVLATREFNDQFLNACGVWKKKLFYCDIENAPILSKNWTDSANQLNLELIVQNDLAEN